MFKLYYRIISEWNNNKNQSKVKTTKLIEIVKIKTEDKFSNKKVNLVVKNLDCHLHHSFLNILTI